MFRFCLLLCVFAAAMGGAVVAQENRGFLGIQLQDITKEEAAKLGWEAPRGIKVGKPDEDGPAAAAGILADDIILSIDGREVEGREGFVTSIGERGAGSQVRLRVLRGGRERTVAVTLGWRPMTMARDLPILQLDTGGHMGIIKGIVFTPDGHHLVSASDDKVIRVWDWRAGATVRSIRGQAAAGLEGSVFGIALSPDGRWLAASGYFGVSSDSNPEERVAPIRLYELASGKLSALLKGHTGGATSLAFSADGKRLNSGSLDRTAIIWDIEQCALIHRLKGHTAEIYAAGLSPDGVRAITGSIDKTLKLWSVADGKLTATLSGGKDTVRALAVSGADGGIASGSDDGEIRLWDGRTGRFLRTLAQQRGTIGALKFSPDGKQILSTCGPGGCNFTQRIWEVATGKELVAYAGHDNIVRAGAVSPGGKVIATGGGKSRQIDVWNANTGQLERRLSGKGTIVWAAAFSADGRHVAWGNIDGGRHNSPFEWQLRLPQLGSALGLPERLNNVNPAHFLRGEAKHGDTTLVHRNGGSYGFDDGSLDVIRGNKVLAAITRGSNDGYGHMAYALSPDDQRPTSNLGWW
jgi:WD40 repeat protein